MPDKSPRISLNNDVQIPALGLGVYLSPRDQTANAVQSAIASGYRLIDDPDVFDMEFMRARAAAAKR
jgi:diketogulonate reductase-like aldo/keto reductase